MGIKRGELPEHVQRAIEQAERGEANRALRKLRTNPQSIHTVSPHIGEAPEGVEPLPKAKGRLRETGMNKLEQAYSDLLDARVYNKELLWRSAHEPIKLRLADNTSYTPDFVVLLATGELEAHEVKGGWFPEHNRVKTKVAASMFPFRFIICRRPKKDAPWEYEEI